MQAAEPGEGTLGEQLERRFGFAADAGHVGPVAAHDLVGRARKAHDLRARQCRFETRHRLRYEQHEAECLRKQLLERRPLPPALGPDLGQRALPVDQRQNALELLADGPRSLTPPPRLFDESSSSLFRGVSARSAGPTITSSSAASNRTRAAANK